MAFLACTGLNSKKKKLKNQAKNSKLQERSNHDGIGTLIGSEQKTIRHPENSPQHDLTSVQVAAPYILLQTNQDADVKENSSDANLFEDIAGQTQIAAAENSLVSFDKQESAPDLGASIHYISSDEGRTHASSVSASAVEQTSFQKNNPSESQYDINEDLAFGMNACAALPTSPSSDLSAETKDQLEQPLTLENYQHEKGVNQLHLHLPLEGKQTSSESRSSDTHVYSWETDPGWRFTYEKMKPHLRSDPDIPVVNLHTLPSLSPEQRSSIQKICGKNSVIWRMEDWELWIFTEVFDEQQITQAVEETFRTNAHTSHWKLTFLPPCPPVHFLSRTSVFYQLVFKVDTVDELRQECTAPLLVNTDENGDLGLYFVSCAHLLQRKLGIPCEQSANVLLRGKADLYVDDFNGNSPLSKHGIVKTDRPLLDRLSPNTNGWVMDGLIVRANVNVDRDLLKQLASTSNYTDTIFGSGKTLTVTGIAEVDRWGDIESYHQDRQLVCVGYGNWLIPGRILIGPSIQLPGHICDDRTLVVMAFEKPLFPGMSGSPVYLALTSGHLVLFGIVCAQQSTTGIKNRQERFRKNLNEIVGVMPVYPFLQWARQESPKNFQQKFTTVHQYLADASKKIDRSECDPGYGTAASSFAQST